MKQRGVKLGSNSNPGSFYGTDNNNALTNANSNATG